MIAATSPYNDRDVIIKATIRDMMNDGSQTFTVKAVGRELKKRGHDLYPQAIVMLLKAQPGLSQHGNKPKYWKWEDAAL